MKIKLGTLRKIIKEEVSRVLLESAPLKPNYAEEVFLRLAKSSPKYAQEIASAWDSLKDGKNFTEVAMDLYSSTKLRLDTLGRKNPDGSISSGGNFERAMTELVPSSVKQSMSNVQLSSLTGDDLVQYSAEQEAARNAPKTSGAARPPWPFDPNYPGKREYDEKTKQWKMVDSDPVSGHSYVR